MNKEILQNLNENQIMIINQTLILIRKLQQAIDRIHNGVDQLIVAQDIKEAMELLEVNLNLFIADEENISEDSSPAPMK